MQGKIKADQKKLKSTLFGWLVLGFFLAGGGQGGSELVFLFCFGQFWGEGCDKQFGAYLD